jgi:hypothetical protein
MIEGIVFTLVFLYLIVTVLTYDDNKIEENLERYKKNEEKTDL